MTWTGFRPSPRNRPDVPGSRASPSVEGHGARSGCGCAAGRCRRRSPWSPWPPGGGGAQEQPGSTSFRIGRTWTRDREALPCWCPRPRRRSPRRPALQQARGRLVFRLQLVKPNGDLDPAGRRPLHQLDPVKLILAANELGRQAPLLDPAGHHGFRNVEKLLASKASTAWVCPSPLAWRLHPELADQTVASRSRGYPLRSGRASTPVGQDRQHRPMSMRTAR